MFVFNFKVNSNLLLKLFLAVLLAIVLGVVGVSIYKLVSSSPDSCTAPNEVHNLTTNNYTNVLKAVHNNLDTYVGQQINFSGYVYRVYDFDENQFVLARDMIISPDNQTVVIGFLCESKEAKNLVDGTWVHISGEITKGNYHGEIPVK